MSLVFSRTNNAHTHNSAGIRNSWGLELKHHTEQLFQCLASKNGDKVINQKQSKRLYVINTDHFIFLANILSHTVDNEPVTILFKKK